MPFLQSVIKDAFPGRGIVEKQQQRAAGMSKSGLTRRKQSKTAQDKSVREWRPDQGHLEGNRAGGHSGQNSSGQYNVSQFLTHRQKSTV